MSEKQLAYLILTESCLMQASFCFEKDKIALAAEFVRIGKELLHQVLRELEGDEQET